MKFLLSLWVGKFINFLINIIDKKRGSNFSGEKALKIDPQMVAHFKGIDYSRVLFITGTNGKSTTNNLVNHILKTNGKTVVSNLEGANMLPGIATALLKASSMSGKLKADYFIFETDERFLPRIYAQLPAENILITNLQKDQTQRNGDPDFIYRKLAPIMKGNIRLFVNNEEPRSRSFGLKHADVVTYGVSRHSDSFSKRDDFPTMACPVCHHKINFEYYNNDGVGPFACSFCENHSEEHADYVVTSADFENRTFELCGLSFTMPYNVPYMLYNYAAAVGVAKELAGIEPAEAVKAFADFKNIGGRYEILNYKDKTIKYMRFKQENPETLQTCINIMAADKEPKMICFGIGTICDYVPYFTEIFYTYDCDFSVLEESNVERYFSFSEAVCYDITQRLLYAGVPDEKISTIETESIDEIFSEIDKVQTKNIYLITKLHTFEEMKKKQKLEEKEV